MVCAAMNKYIRLLFIQLHPDKPGKIGPVLAQLRVHWSHIVPI